ncbi:MAG: hypothetical protein GXP49_05545 [Deltaproteobacteria bacterium]|nr:hypothetical protein [Deltaproteobacteria bacterium]
MRPHETIARFDSFLAAQGSVFEAIVIGGTALGLPGVISRHTRDCDVLQPKVPNDIKDASVRFAAKERDAGRDLQDDWFNDEPASVANLLPKGWKKRLQLVFHGRALVLHTLGRADLLKIKLFALRDRATDLPDCLALAPSAEELAEARPWLYLQDANPLWPSHVDRVLEDLARRLGHGL